VTLEQSKDVVVLEYQTAQGPGTDPYWTGTVEGHKKKFIRVIIGLVLPQLDRQFAAVIVLGELYRSFQPMDWTGLAAAVGSWPEVQGALLQFCRDLKPDHIITENQETRQTLWRIPEISNGPAVTYEAPKYATTEVGRQNVQEMLDEDRLHVGHLLDVMDHEPDQANKALQCAVNWAIDSPRVLSAGPKEARTASHKSVRKRGALREVTFEDDRHKNVININIDQFTGTEEDTRALARRLDDYLSGRLAPAS